MGRFSTLVALALLPLIAACASPQIKPQARMAVFDPAEYAPYVRTGTGRVTGQAFMVQRGGGVVKGAGREVVLVPVTTYSTEWYDRLVIKYENLSEADPRAKSNSRIVIADGDGDFEFEGLPAGEYYLACWINWQVPSGNITSTEGGIAHSKVTVRDGQTTKAVVTR